ncbi:MAG: hypothetical protein ACOCY1_05275 [Halovenus sp.]
MGALGVPKYRPAVGLFVVGAGFGSLALIVVLEIQRSSATDAPVGAGLALLLLFGFGAIAVVCVLLGVILAVFARRSEQPLGVSGVRRNVVGLLLVLPSLVAVVMVPLLGALLLALALILALSGFALAWRETSDNQ